MYGYAEFIPLNEEEILKRITQEEIAEMILGYQPVMYQWIKSPIKVKRGGDNSPGARFEMWNNRLFFIDFGDNPTHRVIFKFVADYYNVKFYEGLQIINQHFELGLGDSNELVIPKPAIYHQQQSVNTEKLRHNIIYKPRPFGNIDKTYWMPYGISKNNLIEDEVVAAIWYKFFSNKQEQWMVIRPSDPTYVFTEFKSRVKVYRPLNKAHRFLTNCSENDIGGYDKLPQTGENLIIKKSYKDHRVIKNHGLPNVIWFQNEGCVPSDEIIIDLCARFKNIYIFFDNDNAGIEAAFKLTAIFNNFCPDIALPCWLPEELQAKGIKDPAEWQKQKGAKELQQFLIYKGLYGRNPENYPRILA